MNVLFFKDLSKKNKDLARVLWEENMREPWDTYNGSDMFVVVHENDIVGGFSVYKDDSDGIKGLFCSGWAGRHKKVPCDKILQQLSYSVGDVYFKTDKRAAKFLLEKIGKKVKTTERFCYYIIRGIKNGTTE